MQSVLSGLWDIGEKMKYSNAASYWFGLSSGVVDIIVPDLSYQTGKLLSFMKNAIVNGGLDPFSGEIHTQDGKVIQQSTSSRGRIFAEQDKMRIGDIAVMDWLNENIDGEITF